MPRFCSTRARIAGSSLASASASSSAALRRRQVPGLQLHPAQRVQRLRREPPVADHRRHRIALLQRAPRAHRVARLVRQHRPVPERRRQRRVILLPGGRHDQRVVRRLRVRAASPPARTPAPGPAARPCPPSPARGCRRSSAEWSTMRGQGRTSDPVERRVRTLKQACQGRVRRARVKRSDVGGRPEPRHPARSDATGPCGNFARPPSCPLCPASRALA